MTTLAQAIRREQWELAALLLLQGMLEAAQRLPEDAIPQLLEALEGEEGPQHQGRGVRDDGEA